MGEVILPDGGCKLVFAPGRSPQGGLDCLKGGKIFEVVVRFCFMGYVTC